MKLSKAIERYIKPFITNDPKVDEQTNRIRTDAFKAGAMWMLNHIKKIVPKELDCFNATDVDWMLKHIEEKDMK